MELPADFLSLGRGSVSLDTIIEKLSYGIMSSTNMSRLTVIYMTLCSSNR